MDPAGGNSTVVSESHPRDGCVYTSLLRSQFVNGEYSELLKRFRQCPGRPKEVAVVVDPATKRSEWMPAKSADLEDEKSFRSDLPSAFSAVAAAGDLWQEVMPEIDRVNKHLQQDPLFGRYAKQILPVPRDTTQDAPARRPADIPIKHQTTASTNSFSASHPVENIVNSFATFSNKIDRLVRGPTDTAASTTPIDSSTIPVTRTPSTSKPGSKESEESPNIDDEAWLCFWIANVAVGEDFQCIPT